MYFKPSLAENKGENESKIRPYILKYFMSKFAVCLFFYKVTNLKSEWVIIPYREIIFLVHGKLTSNLQQICDVERFFPQPAFLYSQLHSLLRGSRQFTQI